ncbi:MAG TPA: HNH endonuclease, partial [Phormidium sp.]
SLNQNIVDGAHIEPFAISFNNEITNGISLCKNHHWAFDKGWFSLTDNYKIIVTTDLQEESPHTRKMKEFQGEDILLPDAKKYDPDKYYPSHNSLRWHRKKWRFQA